jgi:hypothetical protein
MGRWAEVFAALSRGVETADTNDTTRRVQLTVLGWRFSPLWWGSLGSCAPAQRRSLGQIDCPPFSQRVAELVQLDPNS